MFFKSQGKNLPIFLNSIHQLLNSTKCANFAYSILTIHNLDQIRNFFPLNLGCVMVLVFKVPVKSISSIDKGTGIFVCALP